MSSVLHALSSQCGISLEHEQPRRMCRGWVFATELPWLQVSGHAVDELLRGRE